MKVRRISEEDLEVRVKWMNNPRIYESMHYDIPVELDKTTSWYLKNKDNLSRVDLVFVDDNDCPVAMGGLTNFVKEVGKAELYIFVNPEIQQKGIGTVATQLLCQYGFEQFGLRKIWLETNEDNCAARRVYEKCGFKSEGVLRGEYKTNTGEYKDRIYYGLLKDEFFAI